MTRWELARTRRFGCIEAEGESCRCGHCWKEGVSSPPEGKAGDGVERVSIVILLRILHHDGDICNECLHRLLAQTTSTALPLGAHAADIEPSVLSVMSVDFTD